MVGREPGGLTLIVCAEKTVFIDLECQSKLRELMKSWGRRAYLTLTSLVAAGRCRGQYEARIAEISHEE